MSDVEQKLKQMYRALDAMMVSEDAQQIRSHVERITPTSKAPYGTRISWDIKVATEPTKAQNRVSQLIANIACLKDHFKVWCAETTILTQGLHPAVKALGLPKAGMHTFRRGCNCRWELARISSAVIRQQMGHATADMTAPYTGEIPVEEVTKHFQLESNGAAVSA